MRPAEGRSRVSGRKMQPACGWVGGLGLRRARLLLAAAEFGRRVAASRAAEADVIATSDDVVALFRPQLETLAYEECWAVYLTSSNRIIERQRISQGGVQGTVVDIGWLLNGRWNCSPHSWC